MRRSNRCWLSGLMPHKLPSPVCSSALFPMVLKRINEQETGNGYFKCWCIRTGGLQMDVLTQIDATDRDCLET